ncbi:hypothetical protein CgunFtcFv8_009053 [Champsocephalus gunnari]|uniref:Uncharacterized protein n=1 Tax=Champsocephalus gunnari TaxID=52237 RepID=A0AAN8D663_CHAGU|nr:hypothetical protein CgunFtcFv8_009053 [Champsocephalus gunnari]
MVHRVECSRQVQQDEDRGEGGCFSRVQFLSDSKEGSFCGVTCLETRLVRIQKVVLMEITGELFKDSAFKCFRQEREERDRPVVYNVRRVESGFL